MTPEELDKLEALVKAATPEFRLCFDDGITDDATGEQGKPAALYGPGGVWVADLDCGMLPKPQADAIGRSLAALHNAAPALIAAAREVERLRAFVPRWVRRDVNSPWFLMVGNVRLPGSGIADSPIGGVWELETCEKQPNLPTAAAAVCARLGIPSVEVPS